MSRSWVTMAIMNGAAKLELDQPIKWTQKADGDRHLFSSPLRTAISDRVVLFVGVSLSALSSPTIILRDDGPHPNNLIRLDVRPSQPHRNRKTDGEIIRGTHLHAWTDACKGSHATEPDGWPPHGVREDMPTGTADELQTVFEWFCASFSVVLGAHYVWVPPRTIESAPLLTPEGDEIP